MNHTEDTPLYLKDSQDNEMLHWNFPTRSVSVVVGLGALLRVDIIPPDRASLSSTHILIQILSWEGNENVEGPSLSRFLCDWISVLNVSARYRVLVSELDEHWFT